MSLVFPSSIIILQLVIYDYFIFLLSISFWHILTKTAIKWRFIYALCLQAYLVSVKWTYCHETMSGFKHGKLVILIFLFLKQDFFGTWWARG